jgi:hypothetical protein
MEQHCNSCSIILVSQEECLDNNSNRFASMDCRPEHKCTFNCNITLCRCRSKRNSSKRRARLNRHKLLLRVPRHLPLLHQPQCHLPPLFPPLQRMLPPHSLQRSRSKL